MPNTIAFNAGLSVSGSGISFSLNASKSVSQVGADITAQSQVIGTSAEQLDLGSDIGTIGYIMVINQDATNYVELGLEATVVSQNFAKLRAGEFCVLPPGVSTLHAKANTAPCLLSILAIEL